MLANLPCLSSAGPTSHPSQFVLARDTRCVFSDDCSNVISGGLVTGATPVSHLSSGQCPSRYTMFRSVTNHVAAIVSDDRNVDSVIT